MLYPELDIVSSGPPPDGGVQAWSQVFAGHLVLWTTWGYINSFGYFQAHYIETFHKSVSDVSWIVGVQIFLLCFGATFSGRLFDAGYYRHLLIAGFLFQIVGIFTTSVAKEYWQAFLAQGICGGMAATLLWPTHISLISTWFLKSRSFAIALMLCGTSVGGMVWIVIAQQLGPTLGFGWTVRVIGFMVTGFFAIVLVLTRTRIPPREGGPFLELAAFKETSYSLFVAGAFLILWAVYFAFFYVNQYATNIIHVNAKTSLSILYLMNGVSVIGRIVPAIIADRFPLILGPVNMFLILSISSGIIMYSWIAVHDLGGIIAFSAVYGFFGAGLQGLFAAALASLTKDLQKIGVRVGMVLTVASIPSLTGPPLAGTLIQEDNGRYLYTQIWGGTCLVVGGFAILAASLYARKEEKRARANESA
ncbi:MFS general substrate transporter [Rhizodiscina lignyota]|uniref:MFS general substrate transporter n=1 Tax=Rhizodiscina lignyota TaxID=1504668 RepID=A0A9P4IR04_9PEZI|nr:MFS general substrate transporter [Rhizodiscina lignyota]